MNRWVQQYRGLSEAVRSRLVIENDERLYHVEDVLSVNRAVGAPVVFDYLHHTVNPGPASMTQTELLHECFATWRQEDGPPKIHFSTQRTPGPRGAHADYVNSRELMDTLRTMPEHPFDCMLEAKAKDKALLSFEKRFIRLPTGPPGG